MRRSLPAQWGRPAAATVDSFPRWESPRAVGKTQNSSACSEPVAGVSPRSGEDPCLSQANRGSNGVSPRSGEDSRFAGRWVNLRRLRLLIER